MYYTVYKITNNVNEKYYIGKHQTTDVNDNYMGSGKLIKRAIKKYGIENFTKEILFVFDNEEEMCNKEKELVIVSEQTYNLCEGGTGGFGYINSKGLNFGGNHKEASEKGRRAFIKKIKEDELLLQKYRMQCIENNQKMQKALKEKFPQGTKSFLGKSHTNETKRKIGANTSLHQKGSGNSQYGTMWITNGTVNKKIKKESIDDWITLGYYKGRV